MSRHEHDVRLSVFGRADHLTEYCFSRSDALNRIRASEQLVEQEQIDLTDE